MNFISPNAAAQYNIERKIEIQNIQVILVSVMIIQCTSFKIFQFFFSAVHSAIQNINRPT